MRFKRFFGGTIIQILRLLTDIFLSASALSAIAVLPLTQTGALRDPVNLHRLSQHVVIYAVCAALALSLTHAYRMIWRYVSFRDLLLLIQTATLTVIGFAFYDAISMNRDVHAPWPLMAMALSLIWFVNVSFLAAPRLLARAISESRFFARRALDLSDDLAIPALITGDVDRMEAFIRESARNAASRYRIVGVLADNSNLGGSYLHGVQVLGDTSQMREVVHQLVSRGIRADILILARNNATRADYESMLELAGPAGLKVGRLPPHGTLQDRTRVQPVELADLLGRPEITLDEAGVRSMIEGRSIVITGAGGSIGSELTRQIARLKPAKLSIIDFCEFNLYAIDHELAEISPDLSRVTALLDVRDGSLINSFIERVKPDVVFHAAALKHVPLLETHPIEAVKTNVLGTVNLAEACRKYAVPTMVTISTDKAVNPTNVMGASKRLAEAYCQGLDQSLNGSGSTRFITVRFGNVLGSAGSVVPLFQRQIESGGPVTITHPAITRYFMTIPEAVTLVMQAGAHGKGLDEERGSIYVLEMGRPVKIVDLARQMIRLSGHRPDVDIQIKFVGLRPGEKLHEEVIHVDEAIVPTKTSSILKVTPRVTDLRIVRQQLQELIQACNNADGARTLRLLKVSVPEFDAADVSAQILSN